MGKARFKQTAECVSVSVWQGYEVEIVLFLKSFELFFPIIGPHWHCFEMVMIEISPAIIAKSSQGFVGSGCGETSSPWKMYNGHACIGSAEKTVKHVNGKDIVLVEITHE